MSDTVSIMLFVVFPYVAFALAFVGGIVRWRLKPFSVSSLSSQLLESRKLFWGSVPFHWGILIILAGHLFTLFLPSTVAWWNGVPIRLYALEITGLALALWAGFGISVLLYRRITNPKIRVVTTPMDYVVLAVLLLQVLTGIWVAVMLRFGSFWAVGVAVPYMWSLITLRPEPELIQPFPLAIQAHIVMFWVFLAVFPFSRLVHIFTWPLGYVFKPWQKVVDIREPTRVG
ncbi:MAG: respiratory nitrate reductase subunit gamma [Actinomycetia bacterium]|nr:respiratory nitrate reductase subunit gamma [Actinomycetes bacterium]